MKHIAFNSQSRKWELATAAQIAAGQAVTLYWVESMGQWVTVPER